MKTVCFYFQVHQPFRVRQDFSFFHLGSAEPYEDDRKNQAIMRKVAEKCYLPANQVLLESIKEFGPSFRVAFSISGVAIEQMRLWAPDVLDSFRRLVDTGSVEILGETYYHSLAWLTGENEFVAQVERHRDCVKEVFGVRPTAFRNTELIYEDRLGRFLDQMGYAAVLAEGADHVLGWRSPTCVYRPPGAKQIKLLLKHYRLSDDIAFRFSNRQWSEWPLTADRYANWLDAACEDGRTVNLFMDYETFGEHQWADSGIFDFMRALPRYVLGRFRFATPSEVAASLPAVAELSFPGLTSWADTERDISAWLGNSIQNAAFAHVNSLRSAILATGDEALIHAWRKLQTSDHFYYMCTKWFQDGDVHKYFNPYDSPYDGFICHSNAVNQLRFALQEFAPRVKRQPVALEILPRKDVPILEPLPSALQPASADN